MHSLEEVRLVAEGIAAGATASRVALENALKARAEEIDFWK